MNQSSALTSSVDPDDVARFTAIAGEWWDPTGKFAPLHRFNPVRLTFARRSGG
jgi:2-polyprenyl-6-hydroxyphenyl methylase/3-demethylubiquinone-9 3-methyltransferase